jgi:hydroxymethylbilane synthase
VIPERADPRDTLICPAGDTLEELPSGARVGTSSVRRRAQLLAIRPDLQVLPLRGNVDTRLRKVNEGQYDAIILAAAGVTRLELKKNIAQYLTFDFMLPAPGQGALAVQCREDDVQTLSILRAIDHPPTRLAVTAERAFLAALGGGCSLPVGALATVKGNQIELQGVIVSPDGSETLRLQDTHTDPHKLGQELAQQAFTKGAAEVMS